MEQLFEAFGINGKLILAQAINFAVLLVALRYFLYSPVMKTLDERKEKIAKGVEDADKATEMLSTADATVAKLVSTAETDAEEIVSGARHEATLEKARIAKDAEELAARIGADAHARAEEDAAKILRDSEKEIARLAILAAEKAMRSA